MIKNIKICICIVFLVIILIILHMTPNKKNMYGGEEETETDINELAPIDNVDCTMEQVEKHNKPNDKWIYNNGQIYDLTLIIEAELIKLNNWNLKDNLLSRVYKLNSFMDVMSFSNLVSDKSEQIDHHPKMIIDYDTIEFELSTHSVGGITVLDFELANFIEDTYDELFQSD